MKRDRPVGPERVERLKRATVIPEAYDAFNELILEYYDEASGEAVFWKRKVMERIIDKLRAKDRFVRFDEAWLHVADAYRAEGWTVRLDKEKDAGFPQDYYTFGKRRKE